MSALRTLLAHARLLRPKRPAPSPQPSPRPETSPQPSPRGRGGRRGEEAGRNPDVGRGLVARRATQRARFSRERLARLRRIIGAPDDGLLPPIAVQLLASPLHLELLGDPSFPLRALGLVHVANTIDEHRALPVGLGLDLSAFVEDIVSTARGELLTLVTEARVDGELVYRAKTTALQKAKRAAARSVERIAHVAPESELLRRELVAVPESTGRRYAGVAGDLNPIHQHAWLARPFGFRRAIAHGTWTLSRALEVARDVLPAWPRTIACTFRKPVLLPSTIALEVRRDASDVRLRAAWAERAEVEHLSAHIRRLA